MALRDGSVDLLRGATSLEVAQILAVALGDLHTQIEPDIDPGVKASTYRVVLMRL